MRQSEGDVRLLGRMANLMVSCLTQEETVAVAARFLPQLFPGETGALFLRRSAQDLYEPAVFWGEEQPWRSFPGADCWSLRRRRLHSVREGKDQPVCPHTVHDPKRWTSLCIPMTDREEALGVFHLLLPAGGEESKGEEGRSAQREEDRAATGAGSGDALSARRRLAALTADLINLLLVNLRLRKQIDDLSVRDALTGCFNRRYLEETLARELKISQRTGRRLAVILMDIDHFGQFTDAFGHGASSMVLRDLGGFLRERIREADIPCRYGADEFALLFPDTDLSVCRLRAEHLQRMMRDLSLQDGHAHMRRITVSMGVAAYPEQGETMGDLLEAAKTALQKAKQTGRDRVCGAD